MAESFVTVSGVKVKVQGKLLRIARLHGDTYKFLDDPAPVIQALGNVQERIDLFTFMKKPPPSESLLDYPMECDNLAMQPVTTFDDWWTRGVDRKTRNMVRRAVKRGVTVREVPFDSSLVDGIWAIYNESQIRQGKPFPHYGKDVASV